VTASAVYEGEVRHRRFLPGRDDFRYGLAMMYVDLDELPRLFAEHPLWSAGRPNLAWFRRADYLGDSDVPLRLAVEDLVEERTGRRPAGPIRLLTHLRSWGYCFNPVSFYYAFDAHGERVETIVAEITNTPWGERHAYVLDRRRCREGERWMRWEFDKAFHVSPFLPMELRYDWRFREPGERLDVHMTILRRSGERVFDATLRLRRLALTNESLTRVLARHPLMTLRVVAAIYWQAVRCWWRKVPFHRHPAKRERLHG
jgi:DUF1365 family protein